MQRYIIILYGTDWDEKRRRLRHGDGAQDTVNRSDERVRKDCVLRAETVTVATAAAAAAVSINFNVKEHLNHHQHRRRRDRGHHSRHRRSIPRCNAIAIGIIYSHHHHRHSHNLGYSCSVPALLTILQPLLLPLLLLQLPTTTTAMIVLLLLLHRTGAKYVWKYKYLFPTYRWCVCVNPIIMICAHATVSKQITWTCIHVRVNVQCDYRSLVAFTARRRYVDPV